MSAESDLQPAAGNHLSAPARRQPWPRKNTPDQIQARQEILRGLPGWHAENDFVFEWPQPPAAYASVLEALTAHVVLPVSVVGPLPVTMGSYHLDEVSGNVVEDRRHTEEVYVPLAHSEGGLSASMQRGIAAVIDGGTLETWVLRDRITRDSCFIFESAAEAIACAAWLADHAEELRTWLRDPSNPGYAQSFGGVTLLSRHARLWEVDTQVLGSACHVLYRFSTGEACGPNMITRNAFALNQWVSERLVSDTGLRPTRMLVEANMGGDKKPSWQYFLDGGHGKTVFASVRVREQTLRRVLRTSSEDLVALQHVASQGGHASGMQSVAFTPASAIAAMFATTGQDLGMVGTSSMAHDVLDRTSDGVHVGMRFPGLEVGTVGGGTGMPHARAYLSLLGCVGPGSAYRLAQIIAATALCLELSASAAASSPGSEHFAMAHLAASGRSGQAQP
ncbi:MAG: 3-hydroxy-3-methylglutaryl-CoA reductase [Chloroflexi bacterium]|nr:3-hydroxy-3-methylglutaryl-CoA reductase [Chloroflexota bacterium]